MGNPEIDLSLSAFVIASLAVWRVTHLISNEHGPWGLGLALRKLAGNGMLGKMVGCFYCLSFWVALPCVPWLTRQPLTGLVAWFGLSGAAILLQRLTDRSPPPAAWHEDEEVPPASNGEHR